MTSLKTLLLLGVAVTALSACSSDRGPGQIGSANDIVIRNAGDPKAPPPKPLETPEAITEVDMADAPAKATTAVTTEATQTAQNVTAESVPPAPAEKVEAVAPAPTPTTTSASATTPAAPPVVAAPTTPSVPAPVTASAEEVPPAPMRGTKMITPEEAAPAPVAAAEPVAAPPASVPTAPTPTPTPTSEPAPAPTLSMAALQSASPAEIKAIQESLSKAGFYSGKASGKINTETLNGMVRYEAAQGTLPKTPAPVSAPVATPSVKAAAPSAAPAPLPVSSAPASVVKAPAPSASVSPVFPVTPSAVPAPVAPALTAQTALTDPAMIRAVQEKLISAGLFKGAVNGKMDTSLLNALVSYQTSNGLVPGGLNLETVKKLGIVQ